MINQHTNAIPCFTLKSTRCFGDSSRFGFLIDLFFQLNYILFTWYSDPEGHTFPFDEAEKKSLDDGDRLGGVTAS